MKWRASKWKWLFQEHWLRVSCWMRVERAALPSLPFRMARLLPRYSKAVSSRYKDTSHPISKLRDVWDILFHLLSLRRQFTYYLFTITTPFRRRHYYGMPLKSNLPRSHEFINTRKLSRYFSSAREVSILFYSPSMIYDIIGYDIEFVARSLRRMS